MVSCLRPCVAHSFDVRRQDDRVSEVAGHFVVPRLQGDRVWVCVDHLSCSRASHETTSTSQKYYTKLLERRQYILSLDCNTRGRMQQEWISLIVEMDSVMRVCHAHLGSVNFSRPRGRR
jgi:hypothetical protein